MADRYWVGGTGTWNVSNTTNWSTSTGGSGGASTPVAGDDVYFDTNSGTGVVSATTGAICRDIYHNTSGGSISLLIPDGESLSIKRYNFGTHLEDTLTVNGTLTLESSRLFGGTDIDAINGNGEIIVQRITTFSTSLEFYNVIYIAPKIIVDTPTSSIVSFDNENDKTTTYRDIEVINGTKFSVRYGNPVIENLTVSGSEFRVRSDTPTAVQNYSHTEGALRTSAVSLTTVAELTVTGTQDIRRVTVTAITALGNTLTVKNSTDGGNNTNIIFVDVPANLPTTSVIPTNQKTTTSAIINSDTNITNVTNL